MHSFMSVSNIFVQCVHPDDQQDDTGGATRAVEAGHAGNPGGVRQSREVLRWASSQPDPGPGSRVALGWQLPACGAPAERGSATLPPQPAPLNGGLAPNTTIESLLLNKRIF